MLDWQYAQLLHAIEIMLVDVVKLDWSSLFNWDSWKNTVRDLPVDHLSIARVSREATQGNYPGKLPREKPRPIHNTAVHALNGETLDAMRTLIRTRQYAIRTELSYIHWAKRFFSQHLDKSINQLETGYLEHFLSHLAVERIEPARCESDGLEISTNLGGWYKC